MSLFPFNPNAGQHIQGSENGSAPSIPSLGMGFVAHWSKSPNALSANAVLNAAALTASPQAGFTTGVTSPDVARNVSIVSSDATDTTGQVTIHGTNLNAEAISETLTLNGTTTVVGNKAFATVTSVDLPAQHVGGETVSVGYDNKLGLHHTLANNTVLYAFVNNTKEGTAPTIALSKTAVESNTSLLNTTIPGSQVVDIYYIVGT